MVHQFYLTMDYRNQYLVYSISLFLFVLSFNILHFRNVYSEDNGFFGVLPEDYFDPRDYSKQQPSFTDNLENNATLLQNVLSDYQHSGNLTNIMNDNYSNDINFIAAGDWNCNKETAKTIDKIKRLEPELVLGLGDYTFENISPQCWFDISKPINDKIKIAIGNHDLDYQSSYRQLLDHYKLKKPYYSFDYQNIHFIAISSEHPYEIGSKQYEFIKKDLEESVHNPSILWKIVFLHKPMYTSAKFDEKDSEELENTFHKLFESYHVDLVLSGHTQYYQRSLPLSYNQNNPLHPLILNQNNNEYKNSGGVIFLTAGTAGDELHKISYSLSYYVIQKGKFGFLNFDLKNKGHTLIGTFHDTDDTKILDKFVISKVYRGVTKISDDYSKKI
ncbi:MAG TPA: metallophosphoesterase [Nitrososphaeraceae archaeon]|nr:metallophosphoesterase [Nitrososphaeraceae archaeon]